MLPTSLLLLTSTLLIPHVTATPALCNPSNHGYPVPTINQKAADFCQKLDAENFKSKSVVYGIPLMQLSYTQLNGKEACKLDGCVESMETLVMSCKYNNHTIYGKGSLTTDCGTYNFTIAPVLPPSTPLLVASDSSSPAPSPTQTPAASSSSSTGVTAQTGKTDASKGVDTTNAGNGDGIRTGSILLLGAVAGVFIFFL